MHLDHVARERCRIGPARQRELLGEGRGHWSARTRTSTAKLTPNTIGSTIGGTNQLLITRWLRRPGALNPRRAPVVLVANFRRTAWLRRVAPTSGGPRGADRRSEPL